MATRRAILIGAPGPRHNFLDGVEKDIRNMRLHLKSQRGGEWKDEEIYTLISPTPEEVWFLVQSQYADYCFIYFSGHGFTRNRYERMISLKDERAFHDIHFLNNCPKQLIIVDACRNYVRGINGLPEPEFKDRWAALEGTATRELFDRFIVSSPTGKTIVHATQPGKSSFDTDQGGAFTLSLFEMSRSVKSDGGTVVVPIENLVKHAPVYLRNKGNNQVPVIVHKSGDLKVPFAIAYNPTPNVRSRAPLRKQASTSGAGWGVVFGLIAVGLIARYS